LTIDSSQLQLVYAGTGTVKVVGNSSTSAVLYAPSAAVQLAGNSSWYGSIIAGTLDDSGGDAINRLGFIENRDLELRISPLQNELKPWLQDKILTSTGRQQITFGDPEFLLPRRVLSLGLPPGHRTGKN
jgi:hypothetical protein